MTQADQNCPPNGQTGGVLQPPLFPTLPVVLGDYTLIQLLGSHEYSDCYLARQSHVERRVVLEIRHPQPCSTEEATDDFLALARARGAAKLPHTAAVLESATSPEGYTYICHEAPEGTPLSARAAWEQRLTPQQVCSLVSTAGKLYEACAQAGLAAAPLTADMVFLDNAGSVSFLSPVLTGSPTEGDGESQLRGLAAAILPVQPLNVPGQGRISTLLSWMQEGYEGDSLDWPAIINTAELIAEQLKPDTILQVSQPQRYDKEREQRAGKRRRRQQKRSSLLLGMAVLAVLAMGMGGFFLAPDSVPPVSALRGGYVHCKEDGKLIKVAAHPVSIADYREFLSTYPTLEAARRGSITQDIPPSESDPTPAEWEAQLRSATQEAPVTNVSYWQALMYARYHRATLPSAAQLTAARAEAGHPGLEEWTHDEAPAAAPYTKSRLVLPAEAGASPLPESNATARSPQRGFRICP